MSEKYEVMIPVWLTVKVRADSEEEAAAKGAAKMQNRGEEVYVRVDSSGAVVPTQVFSEGYYEGFHDMPVEVSDDGTFELITEGEDNLVYYGGLIQDA